MGRHVKRPFRTRKAKHGTQYLYRLHYVDVCDRDNDGAVSLWAYDAEHAEERFYDEPSDGWRLTRRPYRVRERVS